MPQFDIFSFCSQLFWVFFGFIFLYLSLTFYLLPALATTLKIRKRKLVQTNTISQSSDLSNESNLLADSIRSFIANFNSKVALIETNPTALSSTKSELNLLSLKTESFRQFNFSIVKQTQLTAVFYI